MRSLEPQQVKQLTTLLELDLSGWNHLRQLPDEISELTALTTLNLSGSSFNPMKLAFLPESMGQLTALTTLNLHYCRSLTGLPASMGQLTALTTLNLSGCYKLTGLPAWTEQRTAWVSLGLPPCIQAVPEWVCQLTALTTLNLSGCCKLTEVPESMGQMVALTTLDLSSCDSLTSLPVWIEQRTAWVSLGLPPCIQAVPEWVCQLTALTTLNLRFCDSLTGLPESMGQLAALKTLDLDSCSSLTVLPESVGQLTSLQTLRVTERTDSVLLRVQQIQYGYIPPLVFSLARPSQWDLERSQHAVIIDIPSVLLDAGCPSDPAILKQKPFLRAFELCQLPPERLWLGRSVSSASVDIDWQRCLLTGPRVRRLLEWTQQSSPHCPTSVCLSRILVKPDDFQAAADLARLLQRLATSHLTVLAMSSLTPVPDNVPSEAFQIVFTHCPQLLRFHLTSPGMSPAAFEHLALCFCHAPPDAQRRFVSGCTDFKLSNGREINITSPEQLASLLVVQLDVPIFFIGHSEAGKTQLQLTMRGIRSGRFGTLAGLGRIDRATGTIRTMGASNVGEILGARGASIMLGTSSSVQQKLRLGNVLEVGGQLEYRYLYRFLTSLLRISVVVVRLDDPKHFQGVLKKKKKKEKEEEEEEEEEDIDEKEAAAAAAAAGEGGEEEEFQEQALELEEQEQGEKAERAKRRRNLRRRATVQQKLL